MALKRREKPVAAIRLEPKRSHLAFEPNYVTEPGEILQETLDELGMTQKELAERTGYTRKHVNWLISGKARITHDAAMRLEKVTQVPARFWNNLESQYQERKAHLKAAADASRHAGWLREIPVGELVKRGAIEKRSNPAAQIDQLLSFFGVASVDAWYAGWTNKQLAFRQAAGAEQGTGRIAAWVRLGELEAAKTDCAPYREEQFRAALATIRTLTTLPPREFVPRMKALCAASGVAFVLVPEIPGSRVSGASRWTGDSTAMLALNLRGKTNDRFWFTFFHEAGHIVHDDRNQVFVDLDCADDPRERQANRFATEILIPPPFEPELSTLTTQARVEAFARRIGIHPGIVVGRLRHDGIISPTSMNGLIEDLSWGDLEREPQPAPRDAALSGSGKGQKTRKPTATAGATPFARRPD